jgi:PAS domain S-box-containing protein
MTINATTRTRSSQRAAKPEEAATPVAEQTLIIPLIPPAQSDSRLSALAEMSGNLLWEVDQLGVYTYVSPNVAEVLGYTPAEIVGKTILDLVPAGDAKRFGNQVAAALIGRQAFTEIEHQIIRKDGRLSTLECSGEPILDDAGNLKGFRGVYLDRSRRGHYQTPNTSPVESLALDQEELKRRSQQLAICFMSWGL